MEGTKHSCGFDRVSIHTEEDEESAANLEGQDVPLQANLQAQNPPPPPLRGPTPNTENDLMMTFIQGVITQMMMMTEFLRWMRPTVLHTPRPMQTQIRMKHDEGEGDTKAAETSHALLPFAGKSVIQPNKKQKTRGNANESKDIWFQKPQSYAALFGRNAQPSLTISETANQFQGSRSMRKCFNCGQVGHIGRDCLKTAIVCYYCGGEGHVAACCEQKVPGSTNGNTSIGFRKTQPVLAQSSKTISPFGIMSGTITQSQGSKPGRKCYNCGQEGHIKQDCPKPLITCYNCGGKGHIAKRCRQQTRHKG